MTRKKAEVLTGYEIRRMPSGRNAIRFGAFEREDLVAEVEHRSERVALVWLVNAAWAHLIKQGMNRLDTGFGRSWIGCSAFDGPELSGQRRLWCRPVMVGSGRWRVSAALAGGSPASRLRCSRLAPLPQRERHLRFLSLWKPFLPLLGFWARCSSGRCAGSLQFVFRWPFSVGFLSFLGIGGQVGRPCGDTRVRRWGYVPPKHEVLALGVAAGTRLESESAPECNSIPEG